MPIYGSKERPWSTFFGGLVLDLDPCELEPDQASDCQNVDFRDHALAVRKGRVAYNGSAPTANRVRGLHRHYPVSGSAVFLMQANTAIYEDNGAGSFSSVVTGLTGGSPWDWIGWKGLVYGGNGVDSLQKRSSGGSWSAVANFTAPTVGPTTSLKTLVCEGFNSGTWTVSGSALSQAYSTDPAPLEGSNALKMTATGTGAVGSSLNKVWSNAATIDLSQADYLVVWVYSQHVGTMFKIGVFANGTDPTATTPDFSVFPQFTVGVKESWTPYLIPLSGIPPASRTASPGIGLQFLGKASAVTYNTALWFDQAMARGPLVTDTYDYYVTFATLDSNAAATQESNPGPATLQKVEQTTPTLGVVLTLSSTITSAAPSAANAYRFWRYRDHGTFRKARLVGTAPKSTTTLNGGITSSATTLVLTSATGWSKGCVMTIDSEKLLIIDLNGTSATVTRAYGGTTAASHLNNATITFTEFLDQRSDGSITLEDPEELVSGKIDPPLAFTYAMVNGRLYAGNVTISGSNLPWRIYLSRQNFPEEFSSTQEPDAGPEIPGWVDIPGKDHIRRILEFDGQALIFCHRSIWTLEGSGWDDFALRKRADIGLDAREAVVVAGRLIYFLAEDGLRVLVPNSGNFDGSFETWVLSEPVNSKLYAIPPSTRSLCAMGVDERGRVHLSIVRSGQTLPDAALVFDPQIDGALGRDYNPKRRGWTYYTNFGFVCYCSLKRGGGDAGQLIGGDATTAKIHYLHRSTADADLTSDDGSAIAWSWTSGYDDAGAGTRHEWTYVDAEFDAASGQSVTATPVLDGVASGTTYSLSLGSASSGLVVDRKRTAPGIRARFSALKLSGSHSVAMKCRSVKRGFWERVG